MLRDGPVAFETFDTMSAKTKGRWNNHTFIHVFWFSNFNNQTLGDLGIRPSLQKLIYHGSGPSSSSWSRDPHPKAKVRSWEIINCVQGYKNSHVWLAFNFRKIMVFSAFIFGCPFLHYDILWILLIGIGYACIMDETSLIQPGLVSLQVK